MDYDDEQVEDNKYREQRPSEGRTAVGCLLLLLIGLMIIPQSRDTIIERLMLTPAESSDLQDK